MIMVDASISQIVMKKGINNIMEKKICMICKAVVPYNQFVTHFKECRENLVKRSNGSLKQKATVKSGGCGCGAKKRNRK